MLIKTLFISESFPPVYINLLFTSSSLALHDILLFCLHVKHEQVFW